MKKAAIFFFSVIVLGAQQLGEACECPPIPGPVIAFSKADVVFAGTATEIDETGGTKLEVNEVLKGKLEGEVTYTPSDSCSYIFAADKKYLVYAKMVNGKLTVDLCGSTKVYDEAEDELDQIPRDMKSCKALGGNWGRYGMAGTEECNLYSWDAGKPCTNHSDCASVCYTGEKTTKGTSVTGKCFERTISRGYCLNYVVDGKATGVVCAD